MQVIPVLDLRGGEVVRAVGGERDKYRPIVTPLAPGSSPLAVAGGLLRLHAFRTFYVADLDGIQRGVPDLDAVRHLAEALPRLAIWVDNGAATAADVATLLAVPGVVAVVGSETLHDVAVLVDACRRAPGRIALSLDFRGAAFQGPPELLASTRLWPHTVIAMTLASVGSDGGPDLARIGDLAGRAAPGTRILAAGGVRDRADLLAARAAGAAGALVATALHAGKLKADDLLEVAGL